MNNLTTIPLTDVRDGGPARLAEMRAADARALRDDCLALFPAPARLILPQLDALARRWLTRTSSPYLAEIEAIAATFGFPGVWFLNASYQWGCTALARDEGGVPWLARTLDWPFPGLGRHVEVARMDGGAGEFFSVTWPGYVGALSVMAPKRFAAALNQAPLRRRTSHRWLRSYDIVANAVQTWRLRHMPPDQLLRKVFESCATFAAAREKLETTPVARPVIFALVGCASGERCVIERTEEDFTTRTHETSAANDWLESRAPWEGRMSLSAFFTWSFAQAAEYSCARRTALAHWQGEFERDAFAWLVPPVLNSYTRLAVTMCPARAILRVAGYEVPASGALPERVTQVCEVAPALAEA